MTEINIIIASLGRGGAEHFSMELFSKFKKKKYKVKLIVLTNSKVDIRSVDAPVAILNNRRASHALLDLLILRIKDRNAVWISTGLQSNVVCILSSLLTISLSKLIVRPNNPIEHDLNLIKSKFIRMLVKKSLYKVKKIVFQSESMRDSYESKIKSRNSIIIPNFSDFKFKLIEKSSDKHHVDFVNISRFSEQKDHFFFIELAKQFSKISKEFCFHLYGNGPEYSKFKKAIDDQCLSNYFILHGSIPREQIILSKESIYIQVSRFEGFSNSIVEALNTGLIVYDFTEGFYSSELSNTRNYFQFSKTCFEPSELLKARSAIENEKIIGSGSLNIYESICR